MFSLSDQFGNELKLEDYSEKRIVLFFYPKDHTPGCTKEVCAFRDVHEQLNGLNATVFGISQDSIEEHAAFAVRHRLDFKLLADVDGVVSRLYETAGLFGLNMRTTYVLDKHGLIEMAYRNMFQPHKHIKKVLDVLQT